MEQNETKLKKNNESEETPKDISDVHVEITKPEEKLSNNTEILNRSANTEEDWIRIGKWNGRRVKFATFKEASFAFFITIIGVLIAIGTIYLTFIAIPINQINSKYDETSKSLQSVEDRLKEFREDLNRTKDELRELEDVNEKLKDILSKNNLR